MDEQNPLADRRVRSLMGLSSGVLVAVVAVFFVDPPITYLMLGIAVLDVIATPYILGRAMEQQESDGTGV
jgi:hypothetical protein